MQTRYKYRAAKSDGQTTTGVITAENNDQVLAHLAEQQMIPIHVEEISGRRHSPLMGLFQGSLYERLIMFTGSFTTMYRAGIPILRILSLIRIGPEQGRFNQAIDQIRLGVKSGRPLSEAMADHDDLFSRVYIASVAAGEESGKLDEIMTELRRMMEDELELSRAIKSGVRYPLMVVAAIVMAALVMLFYVVPKFATFYDQFNAQLPLPTRILLGTQHVLSSYWPVLVVVVGVGAFLIHRFLSTESGRYKFDRRMLRLPVFGNLIIKGNVARFGLMFHILFESGLPLIRCLDILADAIKNTAIGAEIRRMTELFRDGKDSQLASAEFEYFPELALQMITIGLESGSLGEMLKEVSGHYSKEVHYTSRQLTAILEPILTVVMGAFVLLLALAIFLPMWNLIKVFKG